MFLVRSRPWVSLFQGEEGSAVLNMQEMGPCRLNPLCSSVLEPDELLCSEPPRPGFLSWSAALLFQLVFFFPFPFQLDSVSKVEEKLSVPFIKHSSSVWSSSWPQTPTDLSHIEVKSWQESDSSFIPQTGSFLATIFQRHVTTSKVLAEWFADESDAASLSRLVHSCRCRTLFCLNEMIESWLCDAVSRRRRKKKIMKKIKASLTSLPVTLAGDSGGGGSHRAARCTEGSKRLSGVNRWEEKGKKVRERGKRGREEWSDSWLRDDH